MVKTLTSKFKVETVWPELVNKRIHQIDSHLKEIQFLNQGGSLVAKGSFRRQIKYVDSDGKFRKIEDKVQFEVMMGVEYPEPLPFFTPELKTDYYIFQPRRLGENQALLEQGFILIINEFEAINQESRLFSILTDVVAAKGKGETVCSLPLKLKRGSHPKKFNGAIAFERAKPPVATGRVSGVVIYRNSHNILKEQEIDNSVSFLINPDQKAPEGQLVVNGTVTGVDWFPPTCGQDWKMELKLSYDWELVIRKELPVIGEEEGAADSDSKVKADILLKEEFFQFPQVFKVEGMNQTGPFEVETEIKRFNWKRVGSGLSISATLSFELYLADASGIEKFQTFDFEINELKENFFKDYGDSSNLTLNFEPDFDFLKINYEQAFFLIEAILKVGVKVYQSKVISLTHADDGTEIIGLAPAAENSFVLLNETMFNLSHPLWKIIEVRHQLSQINPSLKKGWLTLYGLSEVTVVYLDRFHQFREETFRLNFHKNYYWEAVNDEQAFQIDLSPRLEYDSFKNEGGRLFYKYLWHFSAAAFVKRRVLVAVSKEKTNRTLLISQPKLEATCEEFSIQGELQLEFGNPREIASSRSLITEFSWRNALNAILIEGRIGGEIEYWDGEGFLRREKLEFPFWTFINRPRLVDQESVLVPRLRRFSYFPLNPWPWRKGAVRYEVDIEINQSSNEGV
ncbi:MAG: hypothetical protein ACM3YE_13535 [Bacteroidota bacterium]